METLNEYMHIPEPTITKKKSIGWKIVIGLFFLALIAIALVIIFTQTPSDPVKEQLQALREGSINKAYQLTSSDFQQGTSIEKFAMFMDKYPILKNNTGITFNEAKTDGTVGYVSGKLETKDGNSATIEYQLAKENSNWKIQALRLSHFTNGKLATDSDKSGGKISSVLVSNLTDEKGYVTEEKTSLPTSANIIYATAKLTIPQDDVKISALLINTTNGGKIGPSTDKATQKGDVIKAFSFAKENGVWPEGMYELTVSLSTGATKTVKFQVGQVTQK